VLDALGGERYTLAAYSCVYRLTSPFVKYMFTVPAMMSGHVLGKEKYSIVLRYKIHIFSQMYRYTIINYTNVCNFGNLVHQTNVNINNILHVCTQSINESKENRKKT